MSELVTAGKVAEILEGKPKSFRHGEELIAVFRSGDRFFAMEDRCSHADVRLSDGWVDGGCVSCPWHGAQFDLETGEALSLPAILPVRTFPVVIVGDEVKISLAPPR